MFKKFKVVIKDFLGKDYSHNPEDAEKVISYILEKNIEHRNVEIDFRGINTVNTAFCNVIYESLKNRKEDYKVTLVNCNSLILETFNRVRDNYDSKVSSNDL